MSLLIRVPIATLSTLPMLPLILSAISLGSLWIDNETFGYIKPFMEFIWNKLLSPIFGAL